VIAPVLRTARLILRPCREGDLDAQAAAMGATDVMRHLGGALTREESWRKLLCAAGLWPLLGYGYWVIERADDGAYVGQLGFADFKRDLSPAIDGIPEMGWLLASAMHGQGYATEAGLAALAWADGALDAPRTVAIIDPANTPSIRVAEKIGFAQREDAFYKGEPTLLFRRVRR
jgi:RimJ/RimL family protein N-acetyltransferase